MIYPCHMVTILDKLILIVRIPKNGSKFKLSAFCLFCNVNNLVV